MRELVAFLRGKKLFTWVAHQVRSVEGGGLPNEAWIVSDLTGHGAFA